MPSYLDGQLLVAMPGMADERFSRSVIYLCCAFGGRRDGDHRQQAGHRLNMPDLLVQLDIIAETDAIRLPAGIGQCRC